MLQARKSIVLSDRLALVKTRHHIIWLMQWGKVYLRKGASLAQQGDNEESGNSQYRLFLEEDKFNYIRRGTKSLTIGIQIR